ncbi:MAG: hypothetical protein IPO08_09160 [Xanthomonadales bacterium]|nr:hypothetical protein [Xanthomonadales bacterium]
MDFFRPPTSTPLLLQALRSAACYAELAVLSGSWDPNDIEEKVFDRSYKKTGPAKRRATFYKAMHGTVVQPRYLPDIESIFLDTRIRWWRAHPLGEILCNAALEQDGVLKALKTCPAGEVRKLMWDESCVGAFSCEQFRVELPDSIETIEALVRIGTVESLLVLVGRMRLAQLRGRSELDSEYEHAVLKTLPTCVARSPHLLLGSEALLAALDGFLSWAPFSDSRFIGLFWDKQAIDLRHSFDSRLAHEIKRLGVQAPPAEHLAIRKLAVEKILAGQV